MSKSVFRPVFATAIALCMLSGNGLAEPNDTKRDFSNLACKDVMRLSGTDRDIALAFTHGYMLGKKGTTEYDVDALAQVTDRFIDHCLDHPADNALQSFEKIAM